MSFVLLLPSKANELQCKCLIHPEAATECLQEFNCFNLIEQISRRNRHHGHQIYKPRPSHNSWKAHGRCECQPQPQFPKGDPPAQ